MISTIIRLALMALLLYLVGWSDHWRGALVVSLALIFVRDELLGVALKMLVEKLGDE